MVYAQALWARFSALFTNLFDHPDWRNMVDIAILTVFIYQIIKLLMNTRASSLFKGLLVVLAFAWLSDIFQISAVNWLLQQVLSMAIIVVIVLFQPEIRRALDQLGRTKLPSSLFDPVHKSRRRVNAASVDEMMAALTTMSRKKIGALIVFERKTNLGDIIETGTAVDALISDGLLQNIFEPNTPLHDGAVIIRDGRVCAAACILQLTDDKSLSRELGTRHRAAIGITESTDAVSVVVSEETGIISTARDGMMTRRLDEKSLRILLTELCEPKETIHSLWLTEKTHSRKEGTK